MINNFNGIKYNYIIFYFIILINFFLKKINKNNSIKKIIYLS